MKVSLYIYIDGNAKRLELFDDEKISVTQNVQNFQDIAKLFADYSQAFTIPCSPNNNAILSHWYNNSVDGGFDHRYRYDGFIKIDTLTFKVGSFQLNNVTLKDRQPESYNVTFFGKVKQIKDLIGDDKLKDLDYSALNINYTPTTVKNIIEATSFQSLQFPIIAHDRLYTYGGGASTDVTTNTGAIVWNSLFPAVSCLYIIQLMELKYGFEFPFTTDNNFLYSDPFRFLFLLFKNAETMSARTEKVKVNFTTKPSGLLGLDLATDRLSANYFQQWVRTADGVTYNGNLINLLVGVQGSGSVPYRLIIHRNGQLVYTSPTFTAGSGNININNLITFNTSDYLEFFVESDSPMTFFVRLICQFRKTVSFGNDVNETFVVDSPTQSTNSVIDLANYAPDIKCYDFLMGLVKMFNLVIVPQSEDKFTILPLEEWYNRGNKIDLSEYIIADSVTVQPPKIFKEINFKHQKSEAVTNYGFRETFGVNRGYDWGDLNFITDFDTTTEKYSVETPFEDVLWERNGLHWATLKNKDLQNYIPKGMLMYLNNLNLGLPVGFKYFNGTTYDTITNYAQLGNERITANGQQVSINWGIEGNVFNNTGLTTGLYDLYYNQMIQGLYNVRARVLKCKAILPTVQLLSLKLNDRVIIKQKRYVINNITTDLTTGETDLELLTDFRALPIDANGNVNGVTNVSQIGFTAGNPNANVTFIKGEFEQFDIIDSGDWLSGAYPISGGNTGTVDLTLEPPENLDTAPRYSAIPAVYYDADANTYDLFLPVEQASYFPRGAFAEEEEIEIDNTAQVINPEIFIGLNTDFDVEMPVGVLWATATNLTNQVADVVFPITVTANVTGLQRGFFLVITYTSPLGTIYQKLLSITQNA